MLSNIFLVITHKMDPKQILRRINTVITIWPICCSSEPYLEGIAVKKLMQLGILPPDDGHNSLSFPDGFQYYGQQFPVTVRLHVDNLEKPLRKENMVLVYAHYEKKWGEGFELGKSFSH